MTSSGQLPPALLRRGVGRLVQKLRTAAEVKIEDAPALLELSRATVLRMEAGTDGVRLRDLDINRICTVYKADTDTRKTLLAWAKQIRENPKGWWTSYSDTVLPPRMRLLVTLESGANAIYQYESELVAGLLQTRDYATAVLSTPPGYLDPDIIAAKVQLRLDRQAILTGADAPHLHVILNEAVIHRAVGGPQIMAAQLGHLLSLSAEPHVTIRIVPFTAGLHGAAVASSFTLMEFPDYLGGEPPLAYTDSIAGTQYLDRPEDVSGFQRAWDHTEDKALTPDQTRDLLHATQEGLLR